jgi:xanthine/uracil permease
MNANLNPESNFQTPSPPQKGNGHGTVDASVGGLLKELVHEMPSLLTKEVALAKSEARETIRTTKAGVAAVATGGAVVLVGVFVLALAAVYALSAVMAPWLAALIVGAVVTLIGFGMLEAGKKKFQAGSLKPERTLNSLHKDKEAIRGRTP